VTRDVVSYRDLEVWQLSMDLADLVYNITEAFPAGERCGLAHGLQRSLDSGFNNKRETLIRLFQPPVAYAPIPTDTHAINHYPPSP
jgi:hypothetical protein